MVKSLHRSLEAKLASIKDPEYSDSDSDDDQQPETISSKGVGKDGKKRKGHRNKDTSINNQENDDSNEPSTVIYLGHLPQGFEEREITVFLNQFGNVSKCRVSRSTKTGRSRGYAFVDFADEEVAKVVSETMSGYFLLEKRLICHVLPKDKVHEHMFTKPKRIPTKSDKQKKARGEVNQKVRSVDAMAGITKKLIKREEMKRKKLSDLGIDYDFPGYAASAQAVDGGDDNKSKNNSTSTKKKKRKLSEDSKEGKDAAVVKTPKSKKKSKKNEVEEENEEVSVEETKSAKKKKAKKSKTPKKK